MGLLRCFGLPGPLDLLVLLLVLLLAPLAPLAPLGLLGQGRQPRCPGQPADPAAASRRPGLSHGRLVDEQTHERVHLAEMEGGSGRCTAR